MSRRTILSLAAAFVGAMTFISTLSTDALASRRVGVGRAGRGVGVEHSRCLDRLCQWCRQHHCATDRGRPEQPREMASSGMGGVSRASA